jgi:hypothetical protein
MPFFVFRHVYFKADAFVVLSTALADTLINMGFKKKVFLESTAVDDKTTRLRNRMTQTNQLLSVQ